MAQGCNLKTVTVSTAGTRVALSSVSGVPTRVRSFTLTRNHGNSGDYIFVGDSTVASTVYSAILDATNNMVTVNGDFLNNEPGHHNNWIDTSTWYIDASTNGDKAFLTWTA